MTKLQFCLSLREQLRGLPAQEIEERLHFYSEMIEDRVEEGLSEEEAVAAVGKIEEIAAQIQGEALGEKSLKEKKPLKGWALWGVILGAPLWVSLGIAAIAVILSIYISLWAIVISLWAVFASLIAGGLCGMVMGIPFSLGGNLFLGLAMLGAGMVCMGLAVFLYFGCMGAAKGLLYLTKKFGLIFKRGE